MEAVNGEARSKVARGLKTRVTCLLLPFMLSVVAPAAIAPAAIAQETPSGIEPTDIFQLRTQNKMYQVSIIFADIGN